jgi:hypothetical protein
VETPSGGSSRWRRRPGSVHPSRDARIIAPMLDSLLRDGLLLDGVT